MANKVYANADDALSGLLSDGMMLMSGGFGLCGIPENSIGPTLSRARAKMRQAGAGTG